MKKKPTTIDNKGFIKINRSILNWEWYDDINTKVLFIHCLLKANYIDKQYRGIIIKRGSFKTGRIDLSTETGLTQQQIRTCLNRLKSTSEITIKSTNKYSVITVVNYNNYQNINQQNNHQITKRATSNQPQLKNIKNIKNNSTNVEFT